MGNGNSRFNKLFLNSVQSQAQPKTHHVIQDQRKIISLINGHLRDIRTASDLSAFRQLSSCIFFSVS